MHYTPNEQTYAETMIRRLLEAGVGIIILTFESSLAYMTRPYAKMGATVVTESSMDPANTALLIGAEARKALENASRKVNRG